MAGLPLGLIYSVRAFTKARDHGFAWAALALSTIAWSLIALSIVVKLMAG